MLFSKSRLSSSFFYSSRFWNISTFQWHTYNY